MSQLSVDSITGRVSGSAPTFPNGAVVTGIVTATTFDGTATSATVATTLSSAANITTGTISNDRLPATITKNLAGNVTGNVTGTASTASTLAASATGADLTLSGNLTVNGTTTTIDTAITDVDSLSVDGAVTIGSTTTQYSHIKVNRSDSGYIFEGGQTGSFTSRIFADGSATFSTVSDSIGSLRRLDIVSSSVDLTLSAASHAGRLIRMTSTNRTFTIPSGSFSSGDMITIFHVGTGNMTIAQGSSVTLYNAADGATGNRTLAAKGMVTIACTDGASNEFVISGSQLS